MQFTAEATAIALALLASLLFGVGVVITQFGLRYLSPMSGAAISIPFFTLVFLLVSPWLLAGQQVVWKAVPIFVGVGLVFPSLLTTLTFMSNSRLGPVVTGTLGNIAPLFSVGIAVGVLGESLRPLQLLGLVAALAGVVLVSVFRPGGSGRWLGWALLLPIGAAVLRGVVPPIMKIGFAIWPSPVFAGLVGYLVSTLVVLASQRLRTGAFIEKAPLPGYLWFCGVGLANGSATLLLYKAVGLGKVSLVTPLVATYPIVALALSALMLKGVRISGPLAAGNLVAVIGIVLVLLGA